MADNDAKAASTPRPVPSLDQARQRLAGFKSSIEQMTQEEYDAHVAAAAAAEDAMAQGPSSGSARRRQ